MGIIVERTYQVDLAKPMVRQQLRDVLLQGNRNAHRFHVQLTQGGENVGTLEGVTAYFLRADGATVALAGEMESGGAAVLLSSACYAVAGRAQLLVQVVAGSSTVTALWLDVLVAASATDVVVDDGSVVPSLDDLLARISQMESATSAAQAATAAVEPFRNMVQLPITWQVGYRVDYQTGEVTEDAQYAATSSIALAGGYVAQVEVTTAAAADSSGLAFYNADGHVVQCFNLTDGTGLALASHEVAVPAAARSMRFSCRVKNDWYQQAGASITTSYTDVMAAVRGHADDSLASRTELLLLEQRLLSTDWHATNAASGGWTLHAGCYVDAKGNLVESTAFDTWTLVPQRTFWIYAAPEQIPSTKYVSLAVFSGTAIEASSFRVRYRSYQTENTMPDAQSPLKATEDRLLAVSVHAGEDFALMSDDPLEAPQLGATLRLGDGQMQQVRENLGEELTAGRAGVAALRQALLSTDTEAALTEAFPYWTQAPGCYADAKGNLVEDAGYDTYLHTAQQDYCLWAVDPDSSQYLSVAVYSGAEAVSGDFVARYRCYKTENTLPTKAQPLAVNVGQTVAVTVAADASFRLLCNYELVAVQLASGVVLGAEQIAQVAAGLPRTGRFFAVQSTADTVLFDLPTDRAGVHIRYTLARFTDAGRNADVWRLGPASVVEGSGAAAVMRHPVVAEGEWEMALRLQGRSDFIGGKQHGSEVMRTAHFTCNGQAWTPGSNTGVCRELSLQQTTVLYDPQDETTPVGIHERRYIITAEGIHLAQRVVWLVDARCNYSYVCMMPILRGADATTEALVSADCWDDRDFTVYDISQPGFTGRPHQKVHGASRYWLRSAETGVEAEVGCRIVDEPEDSISFVQNTADQYNKVYFSYGGDDYTVTAGDVWQWEQDYRINVAAHAPDRAEDALQLATHAMAGVEALTESRAAACWDVTPAAQVVACWPEPDTALLPCLTLQPMQAGSGTASPQNIRPLTAIDVLRVSATGCNLFDPTATPAEDTGTLYRFAVRANPGASYTISCNVPASGTASIYAGADRVAVTADAPQTVTADDDGTVPVYVRHDATDGGEDAYHALLDGTRRIQVESGAEATAWQPFGSSVILRLGDAIWGGVVDWQQGTLTITHGGYVCTGAEQLSAEGSSLGVYRYAVLNVAEPTVVAGHEGTFSHGSYSRTAYSGLSLRAAAYAANGHVYLLTTHASVEALAAYLAAQYAAGTPVTVAYELAVPVVRQLALPPMQALAGINQVFHGGSGVTQVVYRASLTHVIRELREALAKLAG